MQANTLRHIIFGLFVILAQITIFRHLRILNAESDVILIFILWLMSHHNRTTALFFAAGFGLMQDALLDLWGLNMFAKVLTVMVAYGFVPKSEDSKLQAPQLIVLIGLITLFHNLILLGVSAFSQSFATSAAFWDILIGNTLFTTFFGTFIYIFRTNKN